jgi:hypothetical protein
MTALVRMRLLGFTLTGRAVAPLLTVIVVIATAYGGGAAQPGEAYSFTAMVLFPVLAWQTKLLLDAEPDVQRRLAVVAAGLGRREITAGLVAAAVATLPALAVAVLLPWVVGGVQGPQTPGDLPLAKGLGLGLWALVLAVPPAVALGALASRAATRTSGRGVAVLVSGAVLAVVLGMTGSPVPWLAPPLMATARLATQGASGSQVGVLTGWALLWTAVAIALYVRLRRPSR